MKLAIVGGRDYDNYGNFAKIVDGYIGKYGYPTEMISGGAKGIDTFAERYARENAIPFVVFQPDWSKYGNVAGLMRNTDIISASTHVLALPASQSRGTYDSISKATAMKKHLTIIKV